MDFDDWTWWMWYIKGIVTGLSAGALIFAIAALIT